MSEIKPKIRERYYNEDILLEDFDGLNFSDAKDLLEEYFDKVLKQTNALNVRIHAESEWGGPVIFRVVADKLETSEEATQRAGREGLQRAERIRRLRQNLTYTQREIQKMEAEDAEDSTQ